jgi:hypothetical protein
MPAAPKDGTLQRANHGILSSSWRYDLVLVRPDLHVIWRGNSVPADHRSIAMIATGHA